MNGIDRIRKAIEDSVLDGHLLHVVAWETIQAAIIEARPGEDEICAALRELDEAASSRAIHHITLYATHCGGIHSGGGRESGFSGFQSALAAIHSLMSPPEPTPAECLAVIEHLLDYPPYTGEERQRARDACSRLRKHITKV